MSRAKYHIQNHLVPTVAPLSAAIGLALSASSLQAATITVTSLNDGSVPGQCTLRDALQSANTDVATAGCSAGGGADDIVFQPGLTGAVNLTGGNLSINNEVTITGPGPDQLTISGDGSDRLIAITSTTAGISGLRLENGYINDVFGGSGLVVFDSDISLSDCEIANNASGPNAYGGAITVVESSIAIDQCVISGNTVVGGMILRGSSEAFGGAMLAIGSSVTIASSNFQDNSADLYGGGLALVSSSATVSSVAFIGNEALIGGAISMSDSSFLGMNYVYMIGNDAYGGGGLVVGSLSSAEVSESAFYQNYAAYAGGAALVGVGYSPPLPIQYGSETPRGAPGSDFSLTGPGMLVLDDSYVGANTTTGRGGGLNAKYESDVEITSSEFYYNEASATMTPLANDGWLLGGVVAPSAGGGGMAVLDNAYVTADDVNLKQNYSEVGGGGLADSGGSLIVERSIISNNIALQGGGLQAGTDETAVLPFGRSEARGGGGYNGRVYAIDSLIDGNTADLAGGIGSAFGGAAQVKYSTVSNNSVTDYGGGAAANDGLLAIVDSQIENNQSYQGGGIWSGGTDSQVGIVRSSVSGNQASVGGGVALISAGDQRIKYSTVSDNFAQFFGGVYMLASPMSESGIINSTITGNSAETVGGLAVTEAALDFLTVSHNTATGAPIPRDSRLGRGGVTENPGGALLVGDFTVENSIFADNTSPGDTLDLSISSSGTFSVDYSLIETPGVDVGAGTGNLLSVDPQLGSLGDNGGPTFTRALGPASPALDMGDPATAVPTDQRTDPYPRVFNGRADMGALEFIVDGIFSDRFEQP